MTTIEERWAVVKGYEGYEVSNLGRVRSSKQVRVFGGGYRRWVVDGRGYCRMRLSRGHGSFVTEYVHRLVALAFVGGYFEGAEVDHGDGHGQNNNARNLEWVTHGENIRRAVVRRGGHWMSGVSNEAVKKAVWRVDVEGGAVERFGSTAEAVEELSRQQEAAGGEALGGGAAGNICHAKDLAKVAYGYVWSSREVRDVGEYLRGLPGCGRSPLGGILLASR